MIEVRLRDGPQVIVPRTMAEMSAGALETEVMEFPYRVAVSILESAELKHRVDLASRGSPRLRGRGMTNGLRCS